MEHPAAITSVDFSGNNISPEHCVELVDRYISKLDHLEVLDMKDNKIGPTGAIHLFEALQAHCPKLTYLDVNENAIQDTALYALAVLVKDSQLKTLNVVTNHITIRGLPTLCDGLTRCHTLTHLSLAYNVLGDDGAAMVADMLRRHPSLTTLDLSDNRIEDVGAVALAEAFILSKESRLENLNLSVNHIGDVGFTALAEALTKSRNKHLYHLDLGCNSAVGDAGRRALVESAAHMHHLYSLDLTSCDLSDEDAQGLVRAIRDSRSSLTTVEWYNNPRMTLPTEKELYEAIKAKEARADAGHRYRFSQAIIVTVGIGAALAAVAITVFRKRKL